MSSKSGMIEKNTHYAFLHSGSSRPRRSAAIAALEKIKEIAKEAEKYDDYGEEIEEFIITSSLSEPLRSQSSLEATLPKMSASLEEPVKTEPVKTTPDTLFGIASNPVHLKYNAYEMYLNDFKINHVDNIKKYLNLCEYANMKYIAIPELIKYLITNPALMIHSSAFGEVVVKKMIQFENEIPIANKIGSYTMTEDYRKQLLSLIKILKKTSVMHSKLNTMATKEFYDKIETIAKDF
jgi:hypothetical protein